MTKTKKPSGGAFSISSEDGIKQAQAIREQIRKEELDILEKMYGKYVETLGDGLHALRLKIGVQSFGLAWTDDADATDRDNFEQRTWLKRQLCHALHELVMAEGQRKLSAIIRSELMRAFTDGHDVENLCIMMHPKTLRELTAETDPRTVQPCAGPMQSFQGCAIIEDASQIGFCLVEAGRHGPRMNVERFGGQTFRSKEDGCKIYGTDDG